MTGKWGKLFTKWPVLFYVFTETDRPPAIWRWHQYHVLCHLLKTVLLFWIWFPFTALNIWNSLLKCNIDSSWTQTLERNLLVPEHGDSRYLLPALSADSFYKSNLNAVIQYYILFKKYALFAKYLILSCARISHFSCSIKCSSVSLVPTFLYLSFLYFLYSHIRKKGKR